VRFRPSVLAPLPASFCHDHLFGASAVQRPSLTIIAEPLLASRADWMR
jgi:hypothetical protein